MNPEIQHPEIKDMARNQVFVESAYIFKYSGSGIRISINKIIFAVDKENCIKELNLKYKGECTELVTISK